MPQKFFDPSLYFVTPEIGEDLENWIILIKETVLGGATMVQIRDKSSHARKILTAARAVQPFLKQRGVPLLINDRADIAHALGAEGVHVGQSDLSVSEARALLGSNAIIGISLENEEQIPSALGADYVAASPLFSSRTKKELTSSWGLKGVTRLRTRVELPLVVIGGIQLWHLKELVPRGVDGVAIISAIAKTPSPRLAAEAFLFEWKSLREKAETAKFRKQE